MLARFSLVFLVTFMAIGANLPDSAIAQLGFDADYLKAALVALLVTFLTYHRPVTFIIPVLVLAAASNLPAETAESLGIDRTVALATLIALVILPTVVDWIES